MFMHHLFIIITVCVVCACIVAVSNKLTHYGSIIIIIIIAEPRKRV